MKKVIYLLLVLVIGLGACGKSDDKTLIRIAGDKVTVADFQKRLADIPSYLKEYYKGEEGVKTLLDALVKERVLLKEAELKGLYKNEEIKKRLELLRSQLLVEGMVEELKKTEIAITDNMAAEYFKKHRGEFATSDKVRVRHILLDTREEAEEVLAKVKDGVDFAELAREYSIDKVTAKNGGDVGYFGRGDFITEFEDEAFSMQKKEQVSGVVKTPFGFHILKLMDRKQKDNITLADVKEEVKKKLEKEKFEQWFEDKKKKLKVKVNYDLLGELR
ncbi:MAG: peptidylprolyl isomerase [bacterium]